MIDFTVVVPIYNTNATHLAECVSSILNQSISGFEITLLNDGSTDSETIRMIKYLSKDDRIKVINLKTNVGESAALNYFHSVCKNEYISICDSDDVLHKDKLRLQTEWLKNNPETDVLSTNLYAFSDSDIERNPIFRTHHEIDCLPNKSNWWIANHGTVIYKNQSVENVGGYNEGLRTGQDTDLWKRMFNEGCKFQCLPECLYAWRRHID